LAIHAGIGAEHVDGVPVWARSALHWGSPRVRGDDLIGHDVNLASRVADLAAPGEVLVTAAFVEAAGHRGTFDEIGPVFVKGIRDSVRVYRAL
jgi:class 3 adenylate cyclase